MGRRTSRWAAIILPAIVIAALAWCGWRWWEVRTDRDAMARIEKAMQDGRYAVAVRDLSALLKGRPGWDRATYLLGLCEKARGRLPEADAAWARIGPDSPLGGRAVAGRMDLLIEQGRLADAEHMIEREATARGSEGTALRMLLIPTLVQEGREGEADQLIEARWRHLDARGEGASEQAVNLARLHMELRWSVPPLDSVRDYLDHVGRMVPDDDRIWLGRANLAIRIGSFEEASRWLDACLGRRPDDPAVWRARLDWAMKTQRLADVRAALKHLPASSADAAEVHRLSAWLAAACGDAERERRELAARVATAPEDLEALERLEKLGPGKEDRAGGAELRLRRAEVEGARTRYRELYRRNQPARDAEEMAWLAERLGQRFEAIAFLIAAIAEEPGRDHLRAARHRLDEVGNDPPPDEGRSLFDRLRVDCGGDRPAPVPGPA
jgi:predicted Zn-dependent protease